MTIVDAGRPRRKGRAVTTAREVPPAIQWQEGMLLAPQHFQWQAQRNEALLHYHAVSLSPFHWGVRHLEIDPVLLVDGVLRVVELEAVMPDGLVVSHAEGEGADLKIDLTQYGDDIKRRPLTVHLAVAGRGRDLALKERYGFGEKIGVPDENTGEGDASVPVLEPKLNLIAGDDPPQKYVSFPLAEVTYKNERYDLTNFEPPWLRVAPGSLIYKLCSSVAERLREKARFLSEQVNSPSMSAAEPQILGTRLQIHCLVGELPAFEAMLLTGVSHPFPLYVSFCSLLGHAAGLSQALVPPDLQPYDHNNLHATFEQAYAAITKSINEGIQEAYTSYPFTPDGSEFRLTMDPDWLSRTLVLGVRTRSGVSEAEIESWVMASVISSRSKLVSLRDRRILGARRRRIDSAPDLVPSRGVTLYTLTPDPEFVVPGEDLVILHPGDERRPRPDEIVLHVRNPRT